MKRSKTYDGGISKKFKGNGNLDELWGEDLDVNDVDDCFKLITENLAGASFTCTQRNNVSIVPSYNIFRTEKFNATSTSTQIGTGKNVAGGTFKRHHSFENASSNHPLEAKVKKLEESCLAKEGEVNILRSQIREMRKTTERDYVKNQTEWTEKLKEAKRKLSEVTSELEFKSLEIGNLKQQFDMLKLNGFSQKPSVANQNHLSEPSAAGSKSSEDDESDSDEDSELDIVDEEEFPLENVFPPSTFDSSHRETFMLEFEEDTEAYKLKYKTRGHPIPYVNLDLQRYYSKVEELKPKVTYLREGRLLNFGYVHSDLYAMMKFSAKEFELKENRWYFNKLLCTSEQLMDNFYQYLVTVQKGMLKYKEVKDEDEPKDPITYDVNLSPLIANHWYYNELGVSARQGIACITEILPYCSYLGAYMLRNEHLNFTKKDDDLNFLPVTRRQKESNYRNRHNFLQLMRLAILIIKRLELERYSSGFLCSVISLISKSCMSMELDEATLTYLFDLSFLMFNGKSTPGTCAYSLEYAKTVVKKPMFVDRLCKFPENKHPCILHLFFEQVENFLFKVEDIDVSIPSINLINFSLNIFCHNPRWLNNHGYRGCNCLKKFIITTVFVMHQLMKKYQDNLDECGLIPDKIYDTNVLSKCISLLYLLTAKCHNLLVKCVDTFTQYNDVVHMIINSKRFYEADQQERITALEDLISHEELPPVDLKKLNSIEAWNTLNLRYKKAVGIDVVSTNIDAPVIILPSYQPISDPNDSEFLMPHPRL